MQLSLPFTVQIKLLHMRKMACPDNFYIVRIIFHMYKLQSFQGRQVPFRHGRMEQGFRRPSKLKLRWLGRKVRNISMIIPVDNGDNVNTGLEHDDFIDDFAQRDAS